MRNNDNLSKAISNEFVKAGQNVRKYYQRRLPSDSSKDYYYIMRDTPNNETIIIEYGFADSSGDDVNLLKNNWEDLAESVVRGVANYLKVPYTNNNNNNTENNNIYTVKSGDTLWQIAKNFGVTVDELKNANNLTTNALSINQVLLIPKKDDSGVSEYYVVKSGDTLWQIASKNNLSVDYLKKINNLTTNNLYIGQKLLLMPMSNESGYDSGTYVVKKGDSLYKIAGEYNTTVDELIKLNNLNSTLLNIGQILKIPGEVSTEIYTVKKGDTLYSIANNYNISVSRLKEINNIVNDILTIGQKLIIKK